jgi:hypothetical protein
VATDGAVEAKGSRIFEGSNCQLIAYEIELRRESFDSEALWKTIGREYPNEFRNTCSSRSKDSDYHLHLSWKKQPEAILLTIEFVKGYKEPEQDEKEPFAENFIEWICQFAKKSTFRADVYSDFEFPLNSDRKLKFPLPLKAPLGPDAVDVEIDGISFRFSPTLQGVEKVWLTKGEDELSVHLHAERTIDLKGFDPRNDLNAIDGVLDSVFQSRKEVKGKDNDNTNEP